MLLSTSVDSRSFTPALYARVLAALARVLPACEIGTVRLGGTDPIYPRLMVDLYMTGGTCEIRRIRTRGGELFFFVDGPDAVLPGPRRDEARQALDKFLFVLENVN